MPEAVGGGVCGYRAQAVGYQDGGGAEERGAADGLVVRLVEQDGLPVEFERRLALVRGRIPRTCFEELKRVCDEYFGAPRSEGTSHRVYATPWPGDPRVNIQRGTNGMAKSYQVEQVLAAVDKLEEEGGSSE